MQEAGSAAITPSVPWAAQQQSTMQPSVSGDTRFSEAGTSLMEVSAFMSATMSEQVPMALLDAQRHQNETQREAYEGKLEAERLRNEAQREEYEAKLAAQRDAYEAELKAQHRQNDVQREAHEAKLEAQRQQIEALRHSQEIAALRHSRETDDSRRGRVAAFQARLEALCNAKLLEDDELCAIEDKVADAIGAAHVDDGDDGAWMCVMQMIHLSEGIASEKMFSRQLRRKFA